jgi:hypothetical protein
MIVNLVNYTASTILATTADDSVGVIGPGLMPLHELDERVIKTCEYLMCSVRRWGC